MSESAAGAGLRRLRERVASIPAALRRAATGPDPALRAGETAAFVVTGVGSSAAHARFLVHLLSRELGLRARFASPGEFVGIAPPHAREESLVVFSQGLSPNARFALARSSDFARVVLVTSTPESGGMRSDAPEKRTLLASLEEAGACIVRMPGADEYGTLLRVVGPMVGYLAALRIARAIGGLSFDVDRICSAVSAASARPEPVLPADQESIAFLALGATVELAENLRFKLLEGWRRAAPPVWDLLHLAHGPWQELHDRPALLLALTHAGVEPERTVLREAEAMLVPGRHRLLRFEATLPPPLGIFEHEALVNEWVLRGIERQGLDPARWPGDVSESGLYRLRPEEETTPPKASALAEHTWPEIESQLAQGARTAVIPLAPWSSTALTSPSTPTPASRTRWPSASATPSRKPCGCRRSGPAAPASISSFRERSTSERRRSRRCSWISSTPSRATASATSSSSRPTAGTTLRCKR